MSLYLGDNLVANSVTVPYNWSGTKAEYEALEIINPEWVYYITDTQEIFKGTTLMANAGGNKDLSNLSATGEAHFANPSLSNLNATGEAHFDNKYVNVTGDTMTGNLGLTTDGTSNRHIIIKRTDFDSSSTTTPSAWTGIGTLVMKDGQDRFVGYLESAHDTNNNIITSMSARRVISDTNKTANISVWVDSTGTGSCSFPNTKCVDGQWVSKSLTLTTTTTAGTYTFKLKTSGYLPNDSYKYEVLARLGGYQNSTGTNTWGKLKSDVITDYNYLGIGVDSGLTSTNVPVENSAFLPVNTTLYLYLDNPFTSFSAVLYGYRRIGTNS